MDNRKFLKAALGVCLGLGAVGMGLKLFTFWGQTVFFPVWPNVCDSLVLIVAGAVLAADFARGAYHK